MQEEIGVESAKHYPAALDIQTMGLMLHAATGKVVDGGRCSTVGTDIERNIVDALDSGDIFNNVLATTLLLV